MIPLIQSKCRGKHALDLGCGTGEDTFVLARAGLRVLAIDNNQLYCKQAQANVPTARVYCRDLRASFPSDFYGAGAVIAGLSLHYFDDTDTRDIISRVRLLLADDGVFLVRLNSSDDYNFGAIGHPRLSDEFYLVNGTPKRFFSEQSITDLFRDGWIELFRRKAITRKYGLPKSVWELALQGDA